MKEPQKSMFLFVWILCLTVLLDEEVMVGGSGGRSTHVRVWSMVSSLITTCSCARRSISEACVDIKPFFFNDPAVTLVIFTCAQSCVKNHNPKICRKKSEKSIF